MGDQQQQMEPAGELLARIDESVAAQWRRVNAAAAAATHYTSRELPLSRIKRIMKQDSCLDARLVGMDATPAAAYASELFIEWIVTRAWEFTLHARRRTLQRRDLLDAILSEEKLDMLIDVIADAVEAEAQSESGADGRREAKRARPAPRDIGGPSGYGGSSSSMTSSMTSMSSSMASSGGSMSSTGVADPSGMGMGADKRPLHHVTSAHQPLPPPGCAAQGVALPPASSQGGAPSQGGVVLATTVVSSGRARRSEGDGAKK